MTKAKKRKPDLRLIRLSKTYSIPEIAKTLDRNIATVRLWVRKGLPLLSEQSPTLVLGLDLKKWLQSYWQTKTQKCQLDELFCFKCREPRKPKLNEVEIVIRNEKTILLKGLCIVCNTQMNQTRSISKLDELEKLFFSLSPQMQHL